MFINESDVKKGAPLTVECTTTNNRDRKKQGMYTLTKGPAKLASNASRRGPAQQFGVLESREPNRREHFGPAAEMSSQRPVFNGKKSFGRSNSGGPGSNNTIMMTQEPVPQQHEDNVRYVAEVWHRVMHDFEMSKRSLRQEGPEYYQEKKVSQLQGFEPFDLDTFSANRMYEKIQQSS